MHRSLRPAVPGFPVRRAATDSWWAWFTSQAAPPSGMGATAAQVTAYAMPSEGSYSMLAAHDGSSSPMRRSMSSSVALSIADGTERSSSSGRGDGDGGAASEEASVAARNEESSAQSLGGGDDTDDEDEPPVMMGDQLAPMWLINLARRINPF
jgi:hypothetical protein